MPFIQVFPFVFAFISRKTQEAYEHLFTFIDSYVCKLRCESVISDYENSLRNAVRNCFVTRSMSACWFHLCQACQRHVSQNRTLHKTIKRDSTALTLYHKFLCLPLLPSQFIEPVFNNLVTESLQFTQFKIFVKYYGKQWMTTVIQIISLI